MGGGLADLAMLLKNLKNDAARAQRRQSGEGPGGSGRGGAGRGRGRGRKRKSVGRRAAEEERVVPDSEEVRARLRREDVCFDSGKCVRRVSYPDSFDAAMPDVLKRN